MIIGIRILLLIAVMASAITFAAYLFTRNPRFYQLTKTIIKITLGFAALIAVLYVLERVFLL